MEYTVILNGKSYDLPTYSVKLSCELEDIEKRKAASNSTKASLSLMYGFISKVLGREETQECIGEFENADPNVINIAYFNIVDAYNKPINDYTKEKNAKMIPPEFSKMMENLNGSAKLLNLKK